MIHLAIMGSTRGTAMLALIDAINQGRLSAAIEVVVSNRPQALILERAQAHGIPAHWVAEDSLTRAAYDQKLSELLGHYRVDLIVLVGYMRIISADFVAAWQGKIINTHPSLLPAFAGKMDLAVHQAVLTAGVKETGCTVHYVTTEVDAGPIIVQKICPVSAGDTAESLKARVQALEAGALVDAIRLIDKS